MYPLQVAAFDFRFQARQQMRMPSYMGSAWRGGFGRALRRAVCVTGLTSCPGCPFEASCVYPYLFETAPGGEGGILAAYDRVPNPFVLAPPWDEARLLPTGGETGIRLVLIGRAIEHAGFAKQAVVEVCANTGAATSASTTGSRKSGNPTWTTGYRWMVANL